MKYIVTVDSQDYLVEILDPQHVMVNGTVHEVDFQVVGEDLVFSLLLNGKSYEAFVSQSEGEWEILLKGDMYTARVEDEREKRLRAASGGKVQDHGEFYLKAPMPGLVVAVPVLEGQAVQKNDVLVILESMKMQNELRSPRAGTVARIKVKPGDSVEPKQTLLSVE